MKSLLIAFCMMFFAPTLFACTNFSGDYRTENYTYYSINQNSCDSMSVDDESGSHEYIFDGAERLIAEYEIVLEEGKPFARVQIFLKSKMEGDKWIYHERDVTTNLKTGAVDTLRKWAEVEFNEDTDLLTTLHNEDGSIETFIDVRNR